MDVLCEHVYPVYYKAGMEADDDWPDDETVEIPQEKVEGAFKRLSDALVSERNRRRGAKEIVISKDEISAAPSPI